MKDDTKPNYSNWVPLRMVILLWIGGVLFTALGAAGFLLAWNTILDWVLLVLGIVLLFEAIQMTVLRNTFSFNGRNVMGQIHDFLISKLPWDGKGTLLDVGCGSGALSIKIAKKFPEGKVTGVDWWGPVWDYAQKMCEENAELEGVANATFVKGDACCLDFPDETFDAVVSNFVYHEVRNESDKEKLIMESLRVVKKGGVFAFHDLMESKRLYGDMNKIIEDLKAAGISEVHYEPHTEMQPFIPAYARTPMMLANLGLLWGRK